MKRHTHILALLLTVAAGAAPGALAQAPQAPPGAKFAPGPAHETVRAARAPEDKDQLARRLSSVTLLLENSSAARQIETSGNAQAQEMRAKARALHKQAGQAYQDANYSAASALLDQAAQMMFASARLAAPEQLNAAKQKRDFDSRMESVTALLAAQKRISAEKRLGAKGAEASSALEAQLRSAAALAGSGQLERARTVLDQVYLTTKLSIEAMRNGDTLVRSLQFATKEEEYHYEIDRNDTHKMLIKMLLDEKRSSNAGLDGMVQQYLDQAAKLRVEAEAGAAKKDFEGAIKLLEDATRQLVRAIRSAGVYIPG